MEFVKAIITVKLTIKADSMEKAETVLQNMNYDFKDDKIVDQRIEDWVKEEVS